MDQLRNAVALLGRILLALIFVVAGLEKLFSPGHAADYLLKGGIPANLVTPGVIVAIVIEVIGGAMVILGVRTRTVAVILFLYLIPMTIIFHLIPHQQVQVLKNVAIMGGMLLLAARGPGGASIDGARGRAIP